MGEFNRFKIWFKKKKSSDKESILSINRYPELRCLISKLSYILVKIWVFETSGAKQWVTLQKWFEFLWKFCCFYFTVKLLLLIQWSCWLQLLSFSEPSFYIQRTSVWWSQDGFFFFFTFNSSESHCKTRSAQLKP